MDRPVELIPLACIKCSTPVPASTEEVAWVCIQCGQGLLLDEVRGLAPLEVNYSNAVPPGSLGRPFWVAEGRTAIQRSTFGSRGGQSKDAQRFWAQPRVFFVPAFAASLETLVSIGVDLLMKPPILQAGPPVSFQPVVLPVEDVRAAADFIVLAIEAGRKDKVKEIQHTIELLTPVLWVLP